MGLKEWFSKKEEGTVNPHPKKSERALPEKTEAEKAANLNNATRVFLEIQKKYEKAVQKRIEKEKK